MLFSTGQIVATPGALSALTDNNTSALTYLDKHVRGNWGDLCADDKKVNDDAVKDGDRIFSAYVLPNGEKIWIITERDRSVTTLLLPDEY
jgi:hypothetical protein